MRCRGRTTSTGRSGGRRRSRPGRPSGRTHGRDGGGRWTERGSGASWTISKSQEVPIALTAIPAFGALYAFVVHGAVVVGGLLVAATLALVWAFDGFRG